MRIKDTNDNETYVLTKEGNDIYLDGQLIYTKGKKMEKEEFDRVMGEFEVGGVLDTYKDRKNNYLEMKAALYFSPVAELDYIYLTHFVDELVWYIMQLDDDIEFDFTVSGGRRDMFKFDPLDKWVDVEEASKEDGEIDYFLLLELVLGSDDWDE